MYSSTSNRQTQPRPNITEIVRKYVKGIPQAVLLKARTREGLEALEKERARHKRRLIAILEKDWEDASE
jgi:hypothetical protein